MDKAVARLVDPRLLSVADRLVLARRALGWTQIVLCRITGIAANTWNNYEKRAQRPNLDETLKLLRVGITPDWVYCGMLGNMRPDLADEIERLLMPERLSSRPKKKPGRPDLATRTRERRNAAARRRRAARR